MVHGLLGALVFPAALPVQDKQVVGGPRHRDPALPVWVVAAGDRQQAHPAQPVARVMRGAVVQGEPGLGQRLGHVTRQRRVRVIGRKRMSQSFSQAGTCLGQFPPLGGRSQRPEVRRLEAVGGVAPGPFEKSH